MSTKFQTTFNPYTVNSSKTVIFADFHIKTVIFLIKRLLLALFLQKQLHANQSNIAFSSVFYKELRHI